MILQLSDVEISGKEGYKYLCNKLIVHLIILHDVFEVPMKSQCRESISRRSSLFSGGVEALPKISLDSKLMKIVS